MAQVIFITNPFQPEKDQQLFPCEAGLTIRGWLEKQFPGFREFERATVCTVNDKPKLREEWVTYVIGRNDVVKFATCPGTLIQAVYAIIVLLSVASVVVAARNRPVTPQTQVTPTPDSVFTLKGQRNQNRLGMPIEVRYGKNRIYPSYAANPYNKYVGNDQWVYMLFCLGQGKFEIHSTLIEDTPVEDFPDVVIEITQPGGQVTLFPDNVLTSAEVAGIELKGPNEGGSTVWIEDSPGDPTADPPIDPTGHYAVALAGPFVANPIGTGANYIEVDLVFPKGLYLSNDSGGLSPLTVSVLIEVQSIDNAGAATSGWFALPLFTQTLSTVTPQRFTVGLDFPPDRYQVRVSRTTNTNLDARAGNVVQWESLRAFLPNTRDYGNVTMMAVKARASNNLNDNSASRFNVWATRKLPIWIGGMWSLEEMSTQSIAWAFADIWRNTEYGARYADSYQNLDTLKALDDIWTARGEYFNGSFENPASAWESARAVAMLGRSVPMLVGSQITMVRDVPRTIPSSLYNQENIIAGSWRREIKLVDNNPYDGVLVTYTDPDTFQAETVLCCLSGETGDNPEQITLLGCSNRNHAFRIGMYYRSKTRYQRQNVVWKTELEGRIPSYLDYVGMAYDVPRWGTGGLLLASTGGISIGIPTLHVLTLSEPVAFDGVSTYQILIRRRDGGTLGPFAATAGATDHEVQIACLGEQWEDFDFSRQSELPIYLFGKSNLWGKGLSIVGLKPSDDSTVEFTAANYDDRIFAYDLAEAPVNDNGSSSGSLPSAPRIPQVRGLTVSRSPNVPNEVIAVWQPLSNFIGSYLVQLSYDGTVWGATINTTDTTAKFQVMPNKTLYVRVSAVNSGQGAWAYWVGTGPVEVTDTTIDYGATPTNVTGLTLTPGFQVIWINWTNPTNAQIKNVHIYASMGSTPPVAPLFSLDNSLAYVAHASLGNNETWNYWFQVESVGGKFSTLDGPHSATTSAGVDLADLLGAGLVPPELASVLPSTGNFQGRQVYLTANDNVGGTFAKDKIYRWTSPSTTTGKSFWTTVVPAVDITGTLTDAQLAAISAAKITGQITTTQITNNAISTAKLAAGAVTANEIAANTITAAKISAGTITATEISSGAITTAKLAAGAVTANELAANSIIAGKIAAAAITATAIGTNQIITNSANIANAVITDAHIVDLTATKLTAGTISAVTITLTNSTGCKIVSGNYVAGTSGFQILGNGDIDFRQGVIGGYTITATTIGSVANRVFIQPTLFDVGNPTGSLGNKYGVRMSFQDNPNYSASISGFHNNQPSFFFGDSGSAGMGRMYLYDAGGNIAVNIDVNASSFFNLQLPTSFNAQLIGGPNVGSGQASYLMSMVHRNNGTSKYGLFVGTNWQAQENHIFTAASVDASTGAVTERFSVLGDGTIQYGTYNAITSETLQGWTYIRDLGGTLRKVAIVA